MFRTKFIVPTNPLALTAQHVRTGDAVDTAAPATPQPGKRFPDVADGKWTPSSSDSSHGVELIDDLYMLPSDLLDELIASQRRAIKRSGG